MIKFLDGGDRERLEAPHIHLSAWLYGRLLLLLPFTYENVDSQNLSALWRYEAYGGWREVRGIDMEKRGGLLMVLPLFLSLVVVRVRAYKRLQTRLGGYSPSSGW